MTKSLILPISVTNCNMRTLE